MTKRILLLACTVLLGGCALPVPVQIASWAVDGLLYITTEKTMIDHSVSIVAERDCAMLRVVTEGTLCRDDDAATLIASADPATPPTAVSDVPAQESVQADDDAILRLAAFETAAGGEAIVVPPETARPERVSEDSPSPWQTIRDVALFIEGLIEPDPPEALSDSAPEWTAIVPIPPEDVGWAIHGFDVGLLLIDDAGQYAAATNAPAVSGDRGEDVLRGAGFDDAVDRALRASARRADNARASARRADNARASARRADDRIPPPIQESLRLCGAPGRARRRPPRRSFDPGQGRRRTPPGRRHRRARDS